MGELAVWWWFRFPVRLRRVSRLLSEAWFDGVYLTAWPRMVRGLPWLAFLIGLIEGATHWSVAVYSGGSISASFHADGFIQNLPLLYLAVILGALSAQLGLLLVCGFALGDFTVQVLFAHYSGSVLQVFGQVYAPRLVAYYAFFLLAVTPAITGKLMAGSLPAWLRRQKFVGLAAAAVTLIAVDGVSVYAWTLAAPMIVRVQWVWDGQTSPVSVVSFDERIDPWLPVAAAIAVAVRLALMLTARHRLDGERLKSARAEMLACDRKLRGGGFWTGISTVGSAALVTLTICGLFNSIVRGVIVFAVVLAMFIVRNLVLPKVPAWVWWAQLAGRIPPILRWAASILIAFAITRTTVARSAWSPANNSAAGTFGVEIFCFLLSLVIGLLLFPVSANSNMPPRIGTLEQRGLKAAAFIGIFLLAVRPAWADICADPFCCFGGNNLLAALVIAALLLAALPFILGLADLAALAALAEEAAEGAELAELAEEAEAGEAAADAAETDERLGDMIGILRDAAQGKGNFGLGEASAQEAGELGEAWVGPDSTLASDGKTLVSQDGLRQYRLPSFKPNWGQYQANFEWRLRPGGAWQGNGHLTIF